MARLHHALDVKSKADVRSGEGISFYRCEISKKRGDICLYHLLNFRQKNHLLMKNLGSMVTYSKLLRFSWFIAIFVINFKYNKIPAW